METKKLILPIDYARKKQVSAAYVTKLMKNGKIKVVLHNGKRYIQED
jgi:hypothetical protein